MSTPEFVTVRNGSIVDHTGEPLLLRGMGLGNWLLAEGYMWKLSPGRESARQIEDLVADLVGHDRADRFWTQFRDRFVSEADIQRIAADGMNHVRLPINWRIVMTEEGDIRPDGFDRIDALIDWCRDAGILVLLDLHGAPGGQTGTNIDDSLGQPELFMSDRNADLTEQLWVAIARRYRDEPVVLGYDLLNEPLPDEWQHRYADELVALYRRLTAAIRSVDDRHLLMYEGSHWATNWSMFTDVWDPNSVLQFHKYWSPADRASVQRFVDIGHRLGLPIYMGEGGENNTDWLATAFQLYEDLGIGWCFWPWKKVDTRTSPCSIVPPHGWPAIVAYANNEGEKPAPEAAWQVLCELVAASGIDRCEFHTDVVNALFRRAPLSMPATAFGFRGPGMSFSTTADDVVVLPGFREDDDVRIVLDAASEMPNFDHTDGSPDADLIVRVDPGDWVSYSVELVVDGTLTIVIQAESSAPPRVAIDGLELSWSTTIDDRHEYIAPVLPPGRYDFRVTAPVGGAALRRLTVRVDAGVPTSVIDDEEIDR